MDYGETRVFATGFGFPEGPSFDRDGNLYVTDSQNKAIHRVSPDGVVSIFVRSDGGPNGSAFHRDGDVYAAEPSGKRIVRITPAGELSMLVNEFEAEPFTAPNDVTFDLEGRAYFTDPAEASPDDPRGRVFRIDASGEVHLVAERMAYPNGLAVTPDGRHLMVAETDSEKLHKFRLDNDGNVKAREEFAFVGTGHEDEVGPDGMAFDEAGFLHVAIYGGGIVVVVSPEGEVVEHIPAGGLRPTNVAFGGADNRSLYITETETSVVTVVAAPRPGLRLFGAT